MGVVCHVPFLFYFSKIHLKNLCIRIPLTSSCLRHYQIHCIHAMELMLVNQSLEIFASPFVQAITVLNFAGLI